MGNSRELREKSVFFESEITRFLHQTLGHQQLVTATLEIFLPSAKHTHKFSSRP